MTGIIIPGNGISKATADKRYTLRDDAVYGVRWDYSTDTMQSGIVIGGVFCPMSYTTFPIQEEMVRGLLTSAGNFTPLYPTNSNYLSDGVTLATLDGSAGQVMVRIPKFYTLCLKQANYRYVLISKGLFRFKGYDAWIPPIFGSNNYRYIGAFHGVAATDSTTATLKSIVKNTSGYTVNVYSNPFASKTRAQFRAQMESGFFLYSWGLYEVLFTLFLTEYKTWYSQSILPGHTSTATFNYAYTRKAGRTLSLGNASGSILVDLAGVDADLTSILTSDKYIANSYRGVENFFGSLYQFVDGINVDNTTGTHRVYVCHTPTQFADNTTTNYIDTGHAPGYGAIFNYIKDTAFLGKDCTYYPSELGGTSATYITDYLYSSTGDWYTPVVGGVMNIGGLAGLGCIRTTLNSATYGPTTSTRTAA